MSPATSSRPGIVDLMAVADHLGVGRGHLLQRGERLFGLRFLDHADHRVQDDDEHDGDGIDVLARASSETSAATIRMMTRKLLNWSQSSARNPGRGRSCQLVGAVLAPARLRASCWVSPCSRCVWKLADEFFDRLAVRFLVLHVQSPFEAVAPAWHVRLWYGRAQRRKFEPCDACDYETGSARTNREGRPLRFVNGCRPAVALTRLWRSATKRMSGE